MIKYILDFLLNIPNTFGGLATFILEPIPFVGFNMLELFSVGALTIIFGVKIVRLFI